MSLNADIMAGIQLSLCVVRRFTCDKGYHDIPSSSSVMSSNESLVGLESVILFNGMKNILQSLCIFEFFLGSASHFL